MADILSLANYVQQQGDIGRQQGKQNRLASLMGQAYSAPREQRSALIGQMVATDPQAGMGAQKAFDGMDDSARESLGRYASVFDSLPDEQKPAAYTQFAQQAKALGIPAPDTYSPEYAPHIQKIAQAFGGVGAASGVQSTYVDAAGNRVAIMRDGSTRVLGQNDAGMSQQTIEVQGPDGRPMRYTFDKRTGGYVPMGSASVATQPRAPGEVPFAIDPSLPPSVQADIRANESRWAVMPEVNIGSAGGIPAGVGQSTAEKAYAEQIAKTQAEIDAGGAVTAMEADRKARIAQAEAMAKAQADAQAAQQYGTKEQREAAAEAQKKLPQLQNAIRGVTRIEQALSSLSKGLLGDTGPVDQYFQRYTKGGQELEAAVGAIQNSILALTRVPGVGSQSDLEQRVAMLQYPSLDKAPEVNARTIQNLRLFMQDLATAYQNVTGGRAATQSGQQSRQGPQQTQGWSIQKVGE